MVAKVENYCIEKRTKSISVDKGVPACINCIWFEQHFRPNRGNIAAFVPLSTGYCLLRDKSRGTLEEPCKRYETEKEENA